MPHYTFTDLGMGVAYGINDSGQVAGNNSGGYAVRWSAGATAPTVLSTPGATSSWGYAINASGQVAGGFPPLGAAWWNGEGVPTALDTLGGGSGSVQGINASGEMAGYSFIAYNSASHAVRWAAGTTSPTDLGTLGGTTSQAFGINDGGQVVGYSFSADGENHAIRWSSDGSYTVLGTLGGRGSVAYAINGGGQAAGYSTIASGLGSHAARWDSYGAVTDLGTLGGNISYAYGINAGGWAVGSSMTSGGTTHASLWVGNTIYDLNSLLVGGGGWTLREARGINASGQIIGWGTGANGWQRAFLLTPDGQDPAVPEPSTLALLSSSLLCGVGLLRRRRRA